MLVALANLCSQPLVRPFKLEPATAVLLQKPCVRSSKRHDQERLEGAVRRIEMSLRPSKSPLSETCQFAKSCTSEPRLKQFEKDRYDRSRGFRRQTAGLLSSDITF